MKIANTYICDRAGKYTFECSVEFDDFTQALAFQGKVLALLGVGFVVPAASAVQCTIPIVEAFEKAVEAEKVEAPKPEPEKVEAPKEAEQPKRTRTRKAPSAQMEVPLDAQPTPVPTPTPPTPPIEPVLVQPPPPAPVQVPSEGPQQKHVDCVVRCKTLKEIIIALSEVGVAKDGKTMLSVCEALREFSPVLKAIQPSALHARINFTLQMLEPLPQGE